MSASPASSASPAALEGQGATAAAPDLLIRAVRAEEDAEALTAIANLPGFRRGTMRRPYQTVEETRRWLASLGPGDLLIVAELGGRLVASAGLHRQDGRRGHAATLGLGVHDGHQGRGVGTALMAALIDAADNWLDLRRIELTVFADNHPAIALYERFGFEREGVLRAWAYREGRYADALIMARLRGLP